MVSSQVRALESPRKRASAGNRAQEDILGQVVGFVSTGEVRAQTPHLGLTEAHEARERRFVAGRGSQSTLGQRIHRSQPTSQVPAETSGNSWAGPADYPAMDCDAYRTEFSAVLDGEDATVAPGVLAQHFETCRSCADFRAAAQDLHRRVRIAAAPDVPDLVAPILRAARSPKLPRHRRLSPTDRAAVVRVGRLALGAIGTAQLLGAAPTLLFGSGAGVEAHVSHELGAFDVAVAVGFLAAALRPWLARGMVPLVLALVGGLACVAVSDVVSGRANLGAESVHALAVAGLWSLWLVARSEHRLTGYGHVARQTPWRLTQA